MRQVTYMVLVLLLTRVSIEAGSTQATPTEEIPAFLQEPGYFIEKEGGKWTLKKPRLRVLQISATQTWTIFEDRHRTTVEERKKALPHLRLNREFVAFNPLTRQRTPIEDWKDQSDAQEIEADIQEILSRFAPAATTTSFSSIPLYMARLSGASGHTTEEWNDHQRFVIYIDPFRATGRLHAASTLLHELSHAERYRMRGFHGNRAAVVLPKEDFILLGACDELAAYRAEVALITSFLNSITSDALRRAVSTAMLSVQLRWPATLTLFLGFEGPQDPGEQLKEARKRILLELGSQAGRYWDTHHRDSLNPALLATIRNWYSQSREWSDIVAQSAEWREAGAQIRLDR
jgi:hypothetical protein